MPEANIKRKRSQRTSHIVQLSCGLGNGLKERGKRERERDYKIWMKESYFFQNMMKNGATRIVNAPASNSSESLQDYIVDKILS